MVRTSSLLVPETDIVTVIVVDVTDADAAVMFAEAAKDDDPVPGKNSKLAGAVKIKVEDPGVEKSPLAPSDITIGLNVA
jgi:hypothetical protein